MISADPESYRISPTEIAFLTIESLLHLINLIVLGYVWTNRNYPPLKVKQIQVVAASLLVGIVWWIGALAALRILPQIGYPVFLICELWAVWIQIVFGLSLWCSLLVFRFWRLYVIVILRKTLNGLRFYLTIAAFWFPMVIYGVVCSVLKLDGPVEVDGELQCLFDSSAMYVLFGFLIIYLVSFLTLAILMRNIQQSYLKEYRESVTSFTFFMVCYLTYLVVSATDSHNEIWGRVLNSMLVVLIPTFSFYSAIGSPAYYCLTNREEHQRRFIDTTKSLLIPKNDTVFPPRSFQYQAVNSERG